MYHVCTANVPTPPALCLDTPVLRQKVKFRNGMGLRMGDGISPCFWEIQYYRPSLNDHQWLSAWPAMLWRWSGNGTVCDPFHTLTLTHTHSGPRVAVDLPVNHHPHPSLPPVDSSVTFVGWLAQEILRITDTRYKWGHASCMWGSCDLLLKVMWLRCDRYFDPTCVDHVTCMEGHVTGITCSVKIKFVSTQLAGG